jgi:hypothetical protein
LGRGNLLNRSSNFIRRWPVNPKIAFFGPPNAFVDEISMRMAIDLGVPILHYGDLIERVLNSKDLGVDYNHPFLESVRHYHETEDYEAMRKEKIILKLLRLAPDAQEGFILNDYPRCAGTAELMEEYKGGLNAFVHLNLPDSVLFNLEANRI